MMLFIQRSRAARRSAVGTDRRSGRRVGQKGADRQTFSAPLRARSAIGATSVQVDKADAVGEVCNDGVMKTAGRKFVEIPTLFDDFTLLAKELE